MFNPEKHFWPVNIHQYILVFNKVVVLVKKNVKMTIPVPLW